VARRALDALDLGIVLLTSDQRRVMHANRQAIEMIGASIPLRIMEAVEGYILSRAPSRRLPPAARVEHHGRAFYLRVVSSAGAPSFEVVGLREEVLRDPEAFQRLNARHGVSRRDFQVLCALRLGKTNRQISTELGLAEGTIRRHVARLLERFDAPNRTRLVNLVDQILSDR